MMDQQGQNIIPKLDLTTADLAAENLEKLHSLFPEVVIEGRLNLEVLKTLVGEEVEGKEPYQFTWPGKRESINLANRPLDATLRPEKEESEDWEATKNLYLEGDNLEILKVLRKSYQSQVKMIYIDPPYNTGKDFLYSDKFTDEDKAAYNEKTGQKDEEGNRLKENTESNGRFHSDWCSMMYPRLMVARDLLTDDGVIFISMDDHEQANLKKICDEVFGAKNFVSQLVWTNKEGGGSSDSRLFRIKHEYIFCYGKDINKTSINSFPVEDIERYRCSDKYEKTRGKHQLIKLDSGSLGWVKSLDYPITIDGKTYYAGGDKEKWEIRNSQGGSIKDWGWRWSKEKLLQGIKDDFVVVKNGNIYTKQYLNVDKDGNIKPRTIKPSGVIDKYSSTTSSKNLKQLDLGNIFLYSKPYDLIKELIKYVSNYSENNLILDFFSGSATTAHAVMQLNAEDGGNRRFIMVQLPEACAPTSAAYQAGFKTICEIGKKRIRLAGAKIKEELAEKAGTAAKKVEGGGVLPRQIKKLPWIPAFACSGLIAAFIKTLLKILKTPRKIGSPKQSIISNPIAVI